MTLRRTRRVLICDDDSDNYQRLKRYLSGEGFECAPRVDSEAAVRNALAEADVQERWFHFVMLDMDLSGSSSRRSGVGIYESLLNDYPNEQFIIYTARDVDNYREEVNRLLYRDVALVLLDELLRRENIHLHLRRLLQRNDPRHIFLVHGRHTNKNRRFARILENEFGLRVLTMEDARERLGIRRDYIYEIVLKGIELSIVTVVLFTDEETVQLQRSLWTSADPEASSSTTEVIRRQARANVYIEAGYALGKRPAQTIFVEWPRYRRGFTTPSDFAGIHTIHFKDSREGRALLRRRLRRAGCVLSKGSV